MNKKKNFYPSKRKQAPNFVDLDFGEEIKTLDLSAPFRVNDEEVNKIHQSWERRVLDEWVNPVASVNSNNALSPLSEFVLNRLSYYECASLSTETIILKALNTITDEIFNKGGEFVLVNRDEDSEEIISRLEEKLNQINFWQAIKDNAKKSLIYGTSFLYLGTNGDNESLAKPLNIKDFQGGNARENQITFLKAIEPYSIGASFVETSNPLDLYYMKPKSWYVSGVGRVDCTRLLQLSFFEVPDLIKPLFNYGGISLCQLMRSYVRDADSIRQSLSELFLRFRTMIIKTPMLRNNPQEAVNRAKAIAKSKNNLGMTLLTENEDYIESITPISGLDRIQAQAFESMVISSGLPATKLLGISPSGFNSTGEFDLKNYYDTISGYQNNIIKPLIVEVAQAVLYNLGIDSKLDFEFKPLVKLDEKQIAETGAINSNIAISLQESGIISSEQAFDLLKNAGVLPQNMKLEEEEVDMNLGLEDDPLLV